ncbi:MAG TPA: hypothetical protein VD790_05800 [Thermoleophilaceae bacterium]|nr:hypothetical protein [Thermoleophilaceae bacterium]
MQIRRVLLLFALVLGLSALVAAIAPSPEDRDEGSQEAPTERPAAGTATLQPASVSLSVPPPGARSSMRRVPAGSSFTLAVSVSEPGDVVLEGLGLRQTADPLTPARFELLADPPGSHAVAFVPVAGDRRRAGRIEFEEPATVTQRRRDR